MSRLYTREYQVDMIRETIDFYRLFLGVELKPEDVRKIMYL